MSEPSQHSKHWRSFVRRSPLGLLLDFDGTLVPFSETPDATTIDDELRRLFDRLARAPEISVALVSGRPRTWMAANLDHDPAIWLMAEHGAWRRGEQSWEHTLELDAAPLIELVPELEGIALRHTGALVERKASTIALHYRAVSRSQRLALIVEARAVLLAFLARHPTFEQISGAGVIEVRPTGARKSLVVPWMRARASGDAQLLAVGDDTTDEQMFAALGPLDETILVGPRSQRTHARWHLAAPTNVREFLHWIVDVRAGHESRPVTLPVETSKTLRVDAGSTELLVVSNRLPELRGAELVDESPPTNARLRNKGGLVAALRPALEKRRGTWLGWSGRITSDDEPPMIGIDREAVPPMAWLDFSERWAQQYYAGFCNRALWPLLHSFPERAQFNDDEWQSYADVNDAFATAALELTPRGTIWAHDYHLLLLARALRRRGHAGRLGLFLHVPFPPPDILALLPWAQELIEAMCEFDLVAFHTTAFAANFARCAATLLDAVPVADMVFHRGRRVAVRAIPIGIMGEDWQTDGKDRDEELAPLEGNLAGRRLVLGVDRLDYTKGIPERLLAFGKFLELFPEWRDKVSLVQVSVPSRADVPDYAEQRARIESIVGRINGEFGEAHWVPIRYLYRAYETHQLAELYRLADVGYVTPLRDGMNLVAKEYVAAQDPERPGVLLLSRFAGAAQELDAAVLTNPWHIEGMARDLHRALSMPAEERLQRHARLLAAVQRTSATSWAETFLRELDGTRR
ncbi:MAG TPA: trehalose-phosphatase [Nannocystaceae bacterium]|nr:trehalose-phosphatase [Nannocystaceae bacterium]